LYKLSVSPYDLEDVQRAVRTVTKEGNISPHDGAYSFVGLDRISKDGMSTLFKRDIVAVAEIAEEVLTLVMPGILFSVDDSSALARFAEAFAAHTGHFTTVPELHVEINVTAGLDVDEDFASWQVCAEPHGRDLKAETFFESWMDAVQDLPDTATIHLVFSCFWRDYRSLRGLSTRYGLSKRNVTFRFAIEETFPDQPFHIAQTISAVKDIDVPQQSGIIAARRAVLVDYGCTGFNLRQRQS
jgi:hypothetical protein